MDRNLALEFVRVTEAAAIAASAWIGRGEKNKADAAAVTEMRARFNQINFSGKVVIGEGEKDEAPMLFTGEKLGKGGPAMDLAVDPLECTDSVAYGRYNALSVIASGPRGALLSAPDTYMDKLAVGKAATGAVDLDAPVKVNLRKIAKALGKDVREVTIMLLDRERNVPTIKAIRQAGSRVRLISDGDVAAAVSVCLPGSSIDALMGSGGSTEAVLAAVAVKILAGELFCRFLPRSEKDKLAILKSGASLKKIYRASDLARGSALTFTATGVIDGPLLSGVKDLGSAIVTHSLVIRGISGTIRYITTHHHVA